MYDTLITTALLIYNKSTYKWNAFEQIDMYLTTFRTHIQNMGGELEFNVCFKEVYVWFSNFSDMENGIESSGSK